MSLYQTPKHPKNIWQLLLSVYFKCAEVVSGIKRSYRLIAIGLK